MDPSAWPRIKEIFGEVIEAEPARRAQLLSELCGGDSELRNEVEFLLRQLESADSFLEQPLVARAPRNPCFERGELVASRFRIVRMIGAGGMGEVYEAEDLDVAGTIALKTVRSDLAFDPASLVRFRRELRVARGITHPNICRVFDLGRHELPGGRSLLVLTMELLNGETLATRLQRGPCPLAYAITLARQLTSGLQAAHDAGFLHRDLKPANVLLTPGERFERAVITDFGLARPEFPSGSATALTSPSQVAGTVAYLAPEVLCGEPPSRASDIYSLGVILHECVTGRKPAAGESIRIDDRRWRALVQDCLRSDPLARPDACNLGSRLGRFRSPRTGFRRSRTWIAAIIFLFFVSLSVWISRLIAVTAAIAAGSQLMLIPTRNTTGDRSLDGVAEMVAGVFRQSPHFNLWNQQRLPKILTEMRRPDRPDVDAATWREVALRERVPLVVFSSLNQLGSQYMLQLRTERVGKSPIQPVRGWDQTFPCPSKNAIFDCVREGAKWVRRIAGESGESIAAIDPGISDVTTSSWEALTLYQDAQRAAEGGRADDSLAMLREAIHLDPGFALAHMRLGDRLFTARRQREGLAYWQKAAELVERQRLGGREALMIRALYRREVGDFQAAEPPMLAWYRTYPNDPMIPYHLSRLLANLGRFSDSKRVAEEAVHRVESEWNLIGLFCAQMESNDYGAAAATARKLASFGPWERSALLEGKARAGAGDNAGAAKLWQDVLRSNRVEFAVRVPKLLAHLSANSGDLNSARLALETGLRADEAAGRNPDLVQKLSQLGYVAHLQGRDAEARALARRAAVLEPSPAVIISAGTVLARSGFPAEGEGLIARLDGFDGPRFDVIRWRLRGECLLSRGRTAQALPFLERASQVADQSVPAMYLARAHELARDPEQARVLSERLRRHSGLFWLSAEELLPGEFLEIKGENAR